MFDSTAHNLGMAKKVFKDSNIEEDPGSLLCKIHPLMMFDWKMKELCQKLHDCLGGEKLAYCFLLDAEF